MREAANLHNLELPVVLPGIKVNTGPTNYHPITSMQLQRWNGKSWDVFGDVIAAS
jgi:branched-chain amino acid transport system substrate-binding protein